MRFRPFSIAAALCLVPALFFSAAFAGDFYKWVDDGGAVHFSDSLSQVPEKYRDQVEEKSYAAPPEKSTVRMESDGALPADDPGYAAGAEEGLKRYEIQYRAFEGGARRIIIPVTLNGSVTVPMALDTGAPGLIISPRAAEKLGLFDGGAGKLEVLSGGIGGTVPATRSIIDAVRVGGAEDSFVPVTVTPSISSHFEGLVGMDFMSNFSIEIDTARHVLVLQERPARPNMPGGHDETWWRINFREFAHHRNSWRDYVEYLDGRRKDTRFTGQTMSNIEELKRTAEKQYAEAEKLFSKLDRHASRHAVPMSWRKY